MTLPLRDKDESLKLRLKIWVRKATVYCLWFAIVFFEATEYLRLTRANLATHTTLFNSDSLFLPVLFKNILQENGQIQDWYLTPAPYIFPDFVIQFFSGLSTENSTVSMGIYSISQILVFATLISWIGYEAKLGNLSLYVSAIGTGIFTVLAGQNISPYLFMGMSAWHFGSFINFLICTALSLRAVNKNFRNLEIILLGLSLALFSLADALIIFQYTIPMIVIGFLEVTLRKQKSYLKIIGTVTICSVIGYLSYQQLIPKQTRYSPSFTLSGISHHLQEFGQIFFDFNQKNSVAAISVTAMILAIIISSCRDFYQTLAQKILLTDKHTYIIKSLFTIGSLLTVGVAFLNSSLPTEPRYLIPLFFLPIIFGLQKILSVLNKIRFSRSQGLSFFLAPFAIVLAVFSAQKMDLNHYPKDVQCIDKYLSDNHYKFGIAQYWNAKYLQALLKNDVQIAQAYSGFRNQKWITSDEFFRERYDFLLVSKSDEPPYVLDFSQLEELSQKKSTPKYCGNFVLFGFGNGGATTSRIREVGAVEKWDACGLATRIASLDAEDCTFYARNNHDPGHLMFGPGVELLPGKYLLTGNLTSSGELSGQNFMEAVANNNGTTEILGSVDLSGSDGLNKPNLEFTVMPKQANNEIEFRIFLSQGSALKFYSVALRRIE